MNPELEFYQQQGLSFFPLPYGQKKDDRFKWGVFQKRRPSEAEIKGWFSNDTKHNIAVVCGQVSGNLVILDSDSEQRFWELALIIKEKTGINILDFTKVSRTSKGFHIWLFTDDPVQSAKFPKLDIKGEGGYIVAPPSLHPEGVEYEFLNPLIPIKHIQSLIDIGIDLSQKKEPAPERGHSDNWITAALKGVTKDYRNDTCYRLASYFKNSHPIDITESLLLEWNKRNRPPLEETELLRTIKSAYGRESNNGDNKDSLRISPFSPDSESDSNKSVTEVVTKTLAERIEDWVKDSTGWFSYEDVDREFEIKTESEKSNRRMIFKRFRGKNIIEAHPNNNKLYRHVNVAVRLVDFKQAGNRTPLAVRYPFGIERYFNTYPGNVIALAGAADAGKTALLLNFIRLNQYDFSIFYQTSEMGKEELASCLEKFEGIRIDEWNFIAEERSKDFADVIRPDCINIIDYMELSGDFYAVADYLRQIHDKLAGGIAIVALQKKRGAELGRGGDFGLEKPRLYLTMDKGELAIQKAKNWTNQGENPNGLIVNFKIVAGCRFAVTQPWHLKEN